MAKKLKMSSVLSSGSNNTANIAIGSSITGTSNNTITLGSNVNAIYGNGHGSWGTTATISQPKTKYVILGEELEVDGYKDIITPLIIATLNVLGKPYWLELKKQDIKLTDEISSFIEERITVLDRDKKINDILK